MVSQKSKKLVFAALMTALSFVFLLIGKFVLPTGVISFIPAAPFLNYDPKDIIIVLAGFILGPLYSLVISVIVSFFEMIFVSSTGPIGFVMNVISTCFFACTASAIYKKIMNINKKNANNDGKKVNSTVAAVVGLTAGVIAMTGAMVLWNYLITPLYQIPNLDSYDSETAKQMVAEMRKTVGGMLLTVFVPFNAIKAFINMAFTLILYKPVISALKRAGLTDIIGNDKEGSLFKRPVVACAIGAFVLASCVLAILAIKNVI